LMVPVTIFCSVRVAVTIAETFALQSSVSLLTTHGICGAGVLHHEQFYHAGLVKSGRSARVGSREEW
jgi:hypothetical protein